MNKKVGLNIRWHLRLDTKAFLGRGIGKEISTTKQFLFWKEYGAARSVYLGLVCQLKLKIMYVGDSLKNEKIWRHSLSLSKESSLCAMNFLILRDNTCLKGCAVCN